MKKNKSKFKKNLPNILLAIFFIIGLCIFLYPSVSDLINDYLQNRELNKYQSKISELSNEDYAKIFEKAKNYNSSLVGKTLTDNNQNAKNTDYKNILSIDGSNVIGYLKISKINVRLPIYHGTDPSILQSGVGHIEGTSFPIEGETVHSVLSGHTGLPSSKLLTDLNQLQIGDLFDIVVLNKIYNYKIDQILVVEPDETDALELIDGKNYCTILTCTPYGVNTHRLLVRGELQQTSDNDDFLNEATKINSSIIIIFVSIILMILIFAIMISIRNKKWRDIKK